MSPANDRNKQDVVQSEEGEERMVSPSGAPGRIPEDVNTQSVTARVSSTKFDHIRDLQQKIASGQYQIDVDRIAQGMIQRGVLNNNG